MSKKLSNYKLLQNLSNDNETTNKIIQLRTVPIKEKSYNNMSHIQVYEPNLIEQADLLYLPSDNGYKYALVVVDNYSRKMDAVPLKSKLPLAVVKGFQKIFSRNIISLPKVKIEFDDGNEFKGEVTDYFTSKSIKIKRGVPNRHRMQSNVENKNKLIGDLIFGLQQIEEVKNPNKLNKKWVANLPRIIEELNKNAKPYKDKHPNNSLLTKENKDILNIGQLVRIKLDQPRELGTDKKLIGEFRSTDIRWSKEKYKITNIRLIPNQPPLYEIENHNKNVFTRQQLLVV